MKFIRSVFYFEAIVINFGVGLLCIALPGVFAANFVPEGMPALGLELVRWYGALLWVLAYFEMRTLRGNNPGALAFAIEALLFGDVVHFFASILYVNAGGGTGLGTLFMFGMTIFLATVRVIWLRNYYQNKSPRINLFG